MLVLVGVEILGSVQILHNHLMGMGVDGQGGVTVILAIEFGFMVYFFVWGS